MAAEEVTEFTLPFGMGSIDFSNPVMASMAIVSLIGGFAVFSMTRDLGEQVGQKANSIISSTTGVDTGADGSSEQPALV